MAAIEELIRQEKNGKLSFGNHLMEDTIEGFRAIVDGEMDDYPESCFYNAGTIEDVKQRAKK